MRIFRRSLVSLLGLLACSGSDDPDVPTDLPTGALTAPPPTTLRGTSSPGDLFFLEPAGARVRLTGDRGTPEDPSDDLVAMGELNGSLTEFPFRLDLDETNDETLLPFGSYPVLVLPGLGFALALSDRVVTAIEPGACAAPTSSLAAYQVGLGLGPDARWTRFGTLEPGSGALEYRADRSGAGPTTELTIAGLTCGDDRLARPTAVDTIYTEANGEPTNPWTYGGPTPARTIAFFSESGAMVLDLGLGFGSFLAVPTAQVLDRTSDAAVRLDRRVRGRRLVGFLETVATFQPTDSDPEDPSVARTQRASVLQISIAMADGVNGTLRAVAADGSAVVDDVEVSLAVSAGALSLRAALGGVAPTELRGAAVDTPEGTSFVVSADTDGVELLAALDARLPTPAGQERTARRTTLTLRLGTPRPCGGDLAMPPEYTESLGQPVASVRGLDVDRVDVRLVPGALDATATLTNGDSIDFGAARPYMLLPPGTPVQLSTASPRRVRLYCGPDYPWAPGGDLFAAVDGVDTGAEGNFGFRTPGTYVVEASEVGPGGSESIYYVFEVTP